MEASYAANRDTCLQRQRLHEHHLHLVLRLHARRYSVCEEHRAPPGRTVSVGPLSATADAPDMEPAVRERFVSALAGILRRLVSIIGGNDAGVPAAIAERWLRALHGSWGSYLHTASRAGVHAALSLASTGAMRGASNSTLPTAQECYHGVWSALIRIIWPACRMPGLASRIGQEVLLMCAGGFLPPLIKLLTSTATQTWAAKALADTVSPHARLTPLQSAAEHMRSSMCC